MARVSSLLLSAPPSPSPTGRAVNTLGGAEYTPRGPPHLAQEMTFKEKDTVRNINGKLKARKVCIYIYLKLENPTEEKGCFLFPENLTIHREPRGTIKRFLILEDNGVSKINQAFESNRHRL